MNTVMNILVDVQSCLLGYTAVLNYFFAAVVRWGPATDKE
jgi:hypothetical protein